MSTNEGEKKLSYEPGEHRKKHCWNHPYPAVIQDGSTAIGKCPNTLSKEEARTLLDDAEYDGKVAGQLVADAQPKRMWNVYRGIVYEAAPTQSGSYHGYPWFGRPGRNRLPRAVRKVLAQRAEDQGFSSEFKDWMKIYES